MEIVKWNYIDHPYWGAPSPVFLTICRQILFRKFRTGTIATPIHAPSKGKESLPLAIHYFPSPIVSPCEEKVRLLSQILTFYLRIYPFATKKVSTRKRGRSLPPPIQSLSIEILSICPQIRSKSTNRACIISRTGSIAKGGDSPSKGKECIAKGGDTIREDGACIGEGIARIPDNVGRIGEGLVRIGVPGDRICVPGDKIRIVGDRISIL
jgi:hypothetical protein